MNYIGKNRFFLKETSSTNDALKNIEAVLQEGDVCYCESQTGGKGQRGASWESVAGKNLTCTFYLKPEISIDEIFGLNMLVSLSVHAVVEELLNAEAQIKWPNDILINGKKIAGILIENKVKNNVVFESYIGIGLNVNQGDFSAFKRPATSIFLESGTEILITKVLDLLSIHLQQFYSLYKLKGYKTISFLYHRFLYLKGQQATFMVKGELIKLVIQSVNKKGLLETFDEEGKVLRFDLKEIEFTI